MLTLLPYIWEVINDRHGDKNKRQDVYIRALLMIISGALDRLLFHHHDTWQMFLLGWLTAIAMSFAEFVLLFDYTIAAIFAPQYRWFEYIGKTGVWAKIKWWNALGPWGRFILRFVIFAAASILYFKI